MKVEKNKLVFAVIILIIIAFLVSYYFLFIGGSKAEDDTLKQTSVPALEENQKIYDSKLDAINDLKEVRETNAPSIYDEKFIDSLGYYDPELSEKQKERIIDSIYTLGESRYAAIYSAKEERPNPVLSQKIDTPETQAKRKIEAKEIGLEHQLFFASNPQENEFLSSSTTVSEIPVVVDGTQVVETNSRIRLRITKSTIIENKEIHKNTLVFGFISFQANRVLIKIENINSHPINLKAFDLQDGSEGIYVENNFRAEATTEVLDDLIGDINIPSVPQVTGITKILKRHNRNVKVTILNDYKMILKPQL
ncbi:conjugative transposon protein TraM [uncultured Christiangramia sp.]|uniref:conjugative transposon protein TraM n=1 Tax=Christiangramia sp. 3-2217-3z TaxID=3417564 RepID=UPI0026339864|nr:conjugative transposon protein TraM [uncultured Christiangramia sp.]